MIRIALLAGCLFGSPIALADDRPNVVWIIADDLSPELGCYGYPEVATPNLDRLAAAAVRYTRAFSTAAVCSASRTAFQTGQYQTTVGGHHHNTRIKPKLTDDTPTVTGLMQQAGYFVSNGRGMMEAKLAKSHLNFEYDARTFFDGVDWSPRADGQPFFAQVQIKERHRAFVKADRPRPHDLESDPYELHNLADDPAHSKTLAALRQLVNQWIKDTGDLGEIDEGQTVDLPALMQEKRAYYAKKMKTRGLDPNLSDREYLDWWEKELSVD